MRLLDPRLVSRAGPVRALLAADAVLGVLAALLVLAQAVLIAHVAAGAFAGKSLADLVVPLALLVLATVVRAAAAWGFEAAGRRAANDVLAELRLALVERRLQDQPLALDGAESSEVATVAVSASPASASMVATARAESSTRGASAAMRARSASNSSSSRAQIRSSAFRTLSS